MRQVIRGRERCRIGPGPPGFPFGAVAGGAAPSAARSGAQVCLRSCGGVYEILVCCFPARCRGESGERGHCTAAGTFPGDGPRGRSENWRLPRGAGVLEIAVAGAEVVVVAMVYRTVAVSHCACETTGTLG